MDRQDWILNRAGEHCERRGPSLHFVDEPCYWTVEDFQAKIEQNVDLSCNQAEGTYLLVQIVNLFRCSQSTTLDLKADRALFKGIYDVSCELRVVTESLKRIIEA